MAADRRGPFRFRCVALASDGWRVVFYVDAENRWKAQTTARKAWGEFFGHSRTLAKLTVTGREWAPGYASRAAD